MKLIFSVLLASTWSLGMGAPEQSVEFQGADSAFSVVAVATAKVAIEPPFLRVTVAHAAIRSTSKATGRLHITGYRINLVHSMPHDSWDSIRKSEKIPLDVLLDRLDTESISPRTLMIPIDGIDHLGDKWLVFEVDVDGLSPGFTYSHSQRLSQP